MELIKVLDGRDFCECWDGLCIALEDYENIDCDDYEQQLHKLFEHNSFAFNERKHEYWDLD